MTPTTALLEPSLVDVVAAVGQAADLSEQTRRHWVCSLGQIAKWLDRPAAVIPARWHSVRISVAQLHHARVGVTAKTLANHKSNVRAALRWFGKEQPAPQYGVRLSTEWARFRDRLDDRIRDRLYSLMRYCSARRIGPSAVDDEIFEEYWRYRAETTAQACNNTARRFMVRSWNASAGAIDGCSLRQLTEPPLKVASPATYRRHVRGSTPRKRAAPTCVRPSASIALENSMWFIGFTAVTRRRPSGQRGQPSGRPV
jgi:hypothetical protein